MAYRLHVNEAQRAKLYEVLEPVANFGLGPFFVRLRQAAEVYSSAVPIRAHEIALLEDERVLLLPVIQALNVVAAPGNVHPDDDHPLLYWDSMLGQLPKFEAECPGCLHGFCL